MAVQIRSGAKAKPAATRSTRKTAAAKPATKRTTAKRTTTKPAASATKRTTGRAPGRTRKDGSEPVRRSTPNPNLDAATMKRHIAAVTKAGQARKKAEAAHKAAVQALHEAATAAMDAGVPMARVAEVSGISRQWLYKMGEYADRGGNGSGSKTAAKTAAKTTTAKATTRPTTRGTRSTKASTAKAPAKGGRKISIRK